MINSDQLKKRVWEFKRDTVIKKATLLGYGEEYERLSLLELVCEQNIADLDEFFFSLLPDKVLVEYYERRTLILKKQTEVVNRINELLEQHNKDGE